MRALLSPVIIALILSGYSLSYGQQDAQINLKQLVKNQIAQIKARGLKQMALPAEQKTPVARPAAENIPAGKAVEETENYQDAKAQQDVKSDLQQENMAELTEPVQEQTSQMSAAAEQNNAPVEKKTAAVQKPAAAKAEADKGLFFKLFLLFDFSLVILLFVYWRRRQQSVDKAEKSQFKSNVKKLRSEDKFRRKTQNPADEIRKKLQLDPVCDTNDEALLRKHAKKLSVPAGELHLAARIRALERARD